MYIYMHYIYIVTFTNPGERAKALGMWSATAAAGGAAGSLVGGLLVKYLNWRWILFINVPIGAVLLGFAILFLVESRENNKGGKFTPDIAGAITITGALVSLVYGISQTSVESWDSDKTLWTLMISLGLFVILIILETKVVSQPLIPFSIFKSRTLLGANIVILFFGCGMFSMWFFISLWLQEVYGFDALYTGLSFLPQTVAVAITAIAAGKLSPKYGARNFLIIGCMLVSAGLFWLSRIHPNDTYVSGICGGGISLSLSLSLSVCLSLSLSLSYLSHNSLSYLSHNSLS